MFTKFKHWFRSTIAEEVAKISTSLECERATLRAQIKTLDSYIAAQQQALSKLATISVDGEIARLSKENAQLRSDIRELETHFTNVLDTVKKLHPSLTF